MIEKTIDVVFIAMLGCVFGYLFCWGFYIYGKLTGYDNGVKDTRDVCYPELQKQKNDLDYYKKLVEEQKKEIDLLRCGILKYESKENYNKYF